jgi:SM-20-related protein
MKTAFPDPLLENLADDLVRQGWAIADNALPVKLTRQLASECRQRHAQGLLTEAATGRGNALRIRPTVRGDSIQWLEAGQSAATDEYLLAMDALRRGLNACLYLGLEDYESHFALYPPGAFYLRHLDRFRDDDRRDLSAIFYLNENWGDDAGGELRLFLDGQTVDSRFLDVQPLAGRLVLFRSAQLFHEVLPAQRERLSLTGWFRRRGTGVL